MRSLRAGGAALLVAALAFVCGCSRQSDALRLGVPPQDPAPDIATAIASSLTDAGFAVETVSFDDARALASALATGALDIALIEEPISYDGGASLLIPLYPNVLHVLHRRASSPGTFADLLDRRIYAGPPGSLGHRLAAQLAADFGVADFELLDNPWSETPEVYFIFGGLLSRDALRALSDFTLYGLAPINDSAAGSFVDAIALRYPNLRPFVLPSALYPELNDTPIHTLAVNTLLVSRTDLDNDSTYRIVEHLLQNPQAVRTVYPLAAEVMRMDFGHDRVTVPVHRGARRYLERDRPSFLERYVDIVAFITTIGVGAVSALASWLHRNKRVRKDRVDRYLTKVLEIRAEAATAPRTESLVRLTEIETEVLQLVVDEQVEADAGLLAFLQLCESVRTQVVTANGDTDLNYGKRAVASTIQTLKL